MIEPWTNDIFMYLFMIVSIALIISLSYIKSFRDKIKLLEMTIETMNKTMNRLEDNKTTLEIHDKELKLIINKKNGEIDILIRKNNLIKLLIENNYLDRVRYGEEKNRIIKSKLLELIEHSETNIKKSIRKKIKNICNITLKNNKMEFFRSSKTTPDDVGKFLNGFEKLISLDNEIKDILEGIADEEAKNTAITN